MWDRVQRSEGLAENWQQPRVSDRTCATWGGAGQAGGDGNGGNTPITVRGAAPALQPADSRVARAQAVGLAPRAASASDGFRHGHGDSQPSLATSRPGKTCSSPVNSRERDTRTALASRVDAAISRGPWTLWRRTWRLRPGACRRGRRKSCARRWIVCETCKFLSERFITITRRPSPVREWRAVSGGSAG